jgi:hypothetical protein
MICLSGKQQAGSIYRQSMPKKFLQEFIPPMMANSAKEPFDSPDSIFEVKLDGYRGIAVGETAATTVANNAANKARRAFSPTVNPARRRPSCSLAMRHVVSNSDQRCQH